jgi:hypothetical protein
VDPDLHAMSWLWELGQGVFSSDRDTEYKVPCTRIRIVAAYVAPVLGDVEL